MPHLDENTQYGDEKWLNHFKETTCEYKRKVISLKERRHAIIVIEQISVQNIPKKNDYKRSER